MYYGYCIDKYCSQRNNIVIKAITSTKWGTITSLNTMGLQKWNRFITP